MNERMPGMPPSLQAIIPLYADGARGDLSLRRLGDCLAQLTAAGIAAVVGDASRRRWDEVAAVCQRFGARHIAAPQNEVFAPGAARDAAALAATADVLLFYDVDLAADARTLVRLHDVARQVHASYLAFTMIPCLYLRQSATRALDRGEADLAGLWRRYLAGDFGACINLAVASSALLVRRDHFLALGGHRPAFVGHGGEDLDLIFRLAQDWPLGRPDEDLFVNQRQESIAGSRGFRRHFAYYGLDAAARGLILAHRWHARPAASPYFRAHTRNDQSLQHFMRAAQAMGDAPPALPDRTVAQRTAIVAGPDVSDIQTLRQLLPSLGEYVRVDAPQAVAEGGFTQALLVAATEGAARDPAWLRAAQAVPRAGTLHPEVEAKAAIDTGTGAARWRLTLAERGGAIVRDETHRGLRRFYADGASFKWVFFQGQDVRGGAARTLYAYEPPRFADLPALPPLGDFIADLAARDGHAAADWPGLFANQWKGEALRSRTWRKLGKLIRDPHAFFADSAAAKLLRGFTGPA
jgi:predicted glycosyltransferase involved in capsule biosynthesis